MATAVRARLHVTAVPASHTTTAERTGRRRPGSALIATLASSAVIATTAAFGQAPLRATTGTAAMAGELRLPPGYLALAPICHVFDAFTLFSLSQHAAILAWVFVLVLAWRVRRNRRFARPVSRARRCGREALALGGTLAAVVTFYAVGALLPRPSAFLALGDADELAVDVHSHTSASHDGRASFDAEANRRWHAAAGFQVAYVTDHRSYDGASAGLRGNPATASAGVVLLPGIESRYGGQHVNVLGAMASDSIDRRGRLDVERLTSRASVTGQTPFIALLTAPARLDRIPPELPFNAVELADGAPRGLAFTREHGATLRSLAAAHGAAALAGSNNHGWGSTATAWTVMRVPGWRTMPPAILDTAIRSAMARNDPGIRIVERRTPPPPTGLATWVATPALVAWQIAIEMPAAERWAWLAWIWGGWGGVLLMAALRAPRWRPITIRAPLSLEPQYEQAS